MQRHAMVTSQICRATPHTMINLTLPIYLLYPHPFNPPNTQAPQHPAMDTLMEQPGDFMCSANKELSAPSISDSPTLLSQCSPPAEPAMGAAAALKPIAPAAPAVPAAAATPAPVSGRTYGMAPGSARAAHGLRGGGGGGGGAATPAGRGGTGAQLSDRTRGGMYAPLGGAGGGVASAGGAAPATPANAGSSLSSRTRGVYGAGMGSAVKGGKAAGAADLASTPLTQQVSRGRVGQAMDVLPLQQQAGQLPGRGKGKNDARCRSAAGRQLM